MLTDEIAIDEDVTFGDKLMLLQSMGFDAVASRNALEAAGGDVEIAIEIVMGDETEEIKKQAGGNVATVTARAVEANQFEAATSSSNEAPFSFVGKTPKEVLDHYSKQLLGDKHPAVRSQVKSGCKSIKKSWILAVEKLKEIDDRNQITASAGDVIRECDTKLKSLDQKYQWTENVNAAAAKANKKTIKALDSAKRNLEQRQDDASSSRN